MPTVIRPHGQTHAVLEDVNADIRRLMHEPADERRAVEYRRLLDLWAEASRLDFVRAA